MSDYVQQVIVEAEKYDWRCPCIIQTLLGMYTELGGVYIKISGRQGRPVHYIFDASKSRVLAHCQNCHRWSELTQCQETARIVIREYSGPKPGIMCPCTGD